MASEKIIRQESFSANGYNALTIQNGSGNMIIIRYGKVRVLYGQIKTNSSGTVINIGSLDSGDRPPVKIFFPLSSYNLPGGEGSIENGSIVFAIPNNSNSYKFNCTWITS